MFLIYHTYRGVCFKIDIRSFKTIYRISYRVADQRWAKPYRIWIIDYPTGYIRFKIVDHVTTFALRTTRKSIPKRKKMGDISLPFPKAKSLVFSLSFYVLK